MKNLILVLFAIVTFGFGINAQDLSFKSFDKSLKPKGELVVVEKWDDREDYYYQEWDKYSITQSYFYYNVSDKQVGSVGTKTVFYDELDFENVSVTADSGGKYVYVVIKTKKDKEVVLSIAHEREYYTKYTFSDIKFVAKSKKDADNLISKLKDKAFDMSLDLDAEIERVSPLEDSLKFSEDFPDGATSAQIEAAEKGGGSSKSLSKDADDEDEKTTTTNTNSSNNSASNNSKPKEVTEIWVKLWNKSDGEIDISYESRGAGGSKTQTSISRRSTKGVRMKVGGRVFGANGAVLLTVTAAMDDTEQVIFK